MATPTTAAVCPAAARPEVPPPTRPVGRALLALLAGLLAVVLVAGCDGGVAAPEPREGSGRTRPDAAQVRAEEQRVLDARAAAVRARDLDAFLADVEPSDEALVRRQTRYFRNLVQLPLAELSWEVQPESWTGVEPLASWGEVVSVPRLLLTTRLEGYDAAPVRRVVGLAFSFDAADGRARIVSDTTGTGEPLAEGPLAPWDLVRTTVRSAPGVLGVFDRGTRGDADAVVGAVSDGIVDLRDALPFDWDERVVVYHVSDERILASFTDVPGGVITGLGAMTFPEYAADGRGTVSSTRMLVMRSSVEAGEPFLGRIARHELSHVAVGPRDDGAPTWVSEGLAEYLGARPLPAGERIIPTSALERARGPVTGMPPSRDFNGGDQEWHYALSWMAVDWIAETRGEDAVWRLVDAMHAAGASGPVADQDAVLRDVLGVGERELAEAATARIRAIYG